MVKWELLYLIKALEKEFIWRYVPFEKMSLQSEWIQQNRLHVAYELPSIDERVLECKERKKMYYGREGQCSYEVDVLISSNRGRVIGLGGRILDYHRVETV